MDGRSLAGVPAEVSTARIKGPPGTQVELRVVSGSGGGSRNVRLERASVKVPVARGEIRRAGDEQGRLRPIRELQGGGPRRAPVRRSSVSTDRGAEGVVLDLRDNGGGLLNEAVLSASLFLPKGAAGRLHRQPHAWATASTRPSGDPLAKRPTVVLINRDTASAAEILASALGDHRLATIVGTRSFGKGTFQELIHLAAGGALDLTVGEYFTAERDLAGRHGDQARRSGQSTIPTTPQDEGLRRALAVLAERIAVENR